MPKYVTVDVTQEDIDQGFQCASGSCPIALAIRRKFDLDCSEIAVNYGAVVRFAYDEDGDLHYVNGFATYGDWEDWLKLSTRGIRFIKGFDHDGRAAVKPQKFRFMVLKDI